MFKLLTATAMLAAFVAPAMAEQPHDMVCRGTLNNAGTAPDPYYTDVVWVMPEATAPGKGNCFFRLKETNVVIPILSVCSIGQPCEIKATVHNHEDVGYEHCGRGGCTSYQITKVNSVRRVK